MTLRQMEYVVAIADAGSVTAAAEALHVAQPSLSQQLRTLERELGVELFVRGGRGLVPTAAGRGFLTDARAALDASRRARTVAQACGGAIAGELIVAVERSHAVLQLPAALGVLRRLHPALRIEVVEVGACAELERAVRTGTADVAVGGLPDASDLQVHPLGVEAFVVVLPEGDALLGCGAPVRLRSLGGRAWISHGAGCVEERLLTEAMRREGVEVDTVARTTQVDTAIRLATAGIGFAVVPEGAVDATARPLARRLAPTLERAVAVATRTPPGLAESALVDALLVADWSAAPIAPTAPAAVSA
ncbi:LysR family transcriptional regulator [Patulibacter sp.]|uniref:LysR family transcriptional regulator n=1 Tax=Patulibacter sp. TaxID=1912859 RepID=UPI00271E00F4|nr:LysR family transcriptional regulator [Patulibacter sp.]MDO9408980.1 LysR family transcriptional regulator [Patulibacter sp.]